VTRTEIPLIEVSSPEPRERGRQYGEAARSQIEASIGYYREGFERSAGLTWDRVLEQVPRWNPLVDEYLPGILEEIGGIAEGADRRTEEILALNGRGELSIGDPFGEEECSSFALLPEGTGDGRAYCGQNWDWRAGTRDTVVMLRIEQPLLPTIVMQTEAGQVGRQGANSAGLGLNANGLGARFGSRLGIPQPFIRRKILDSAGLDDALHAVFSSRQSLCTNLLITHRDGFAIDLETTPARHGWLYPEDGMLVHANHFQAFVPEQLAETYRPFSPDSLYRVPRIERVLRRARDAATSEGVRATIAEALGDHFGYPNSVCNHPDERSHPLDRTITVASSIVDLTTGEYWMAFGPPCDNDYELLPWRLYESESPSGARDFATPAISG
jgi:isopenicillin-N N-acyltransferase-like protein